MTLHYEASSFPNLAQGRRFPAHPPRPRRRGDQVTIFCTHMLLQMLRAVLGATLTISLMQQR
jgi:hypothetical protein